MRPLVDSRLLDRLAPSFFPSRVTIEVNTPTRSASGAEVPGWAPLAGHVDIPAAVAPAGGNERRSSLMTTAETTHIAMLNGRFPTIIAAHRAVVDGATTYDITVVEQASQGVVTRLGLRTIAPGAGG